MSEQIAIRLHLTDAGRLGRLRQRPRLIVCAAADALWLRADDPSEELAAELIALPGSHFQVLPDRQLVPAGRRVPAGCLPPGPWVELAHWMSVKTAPPALGATIARKVSLRLVRGGTEKESNVLVLTADAWFAYAATAPKVRLDRLAFALSEDGQAVVRGTPLPPLPGERFVEQAGVAAPAGWNWSPAVDAASLRELLELTDGDLALLQQGGGWEHISADEFVRATRSAARLSAARLSVARLSEAARAAGGGDA